MQQCSLRNAGGFAWLDADGVSGLFTETSKGDRDRFAALLDCSGSTSSEEHSAHIHAIGSV